MESTTSTTTGANPFELMAATPRTAACGTAVAAPASRAWERTRASIAAPTGGQVRPRTGDVRPGHLATPTTPLRGTPTSSPPD
ncbi:hypothetical protein [Kineococcus sp. SYSU DK004]|uniref:hypothetical protein n=1 Tax=Kineococcus sp. SYSU DK004 TaxID=3383125 RepID=UPI003D7CB0A4